jgi:hypothetical protein
MQKAYKAGKMQVSAARHFVVNLLSENQVRTSGQEIESAKIKMSE